jgi:hypothetical protein
VNLTRALDLGRSNARYVAGERRDLTKNATLDRDSALADGLEAQRLNAKIEAPRPLVDPRLGEANVDRQRVVPLQVVGLSERDSCELDDSEVRFQPSQKCANRTLRRNVRERPRHLLQANLRHSCSDGLTDRRSAAANSASEAARAPKVDARRLPNHN